MDINTVNCIDYRYSGSLWNRFLQFLRIREKEIEEYGLTFIDGLKIEIENGGGTNEQIRKTEP